jgi:hypothetical protein
MPELVGWVIAAVLLVSSGHGFRCWYREFRDVKGGGTGDKS